MCLIWYVLHCEEGNEKNAAELLKQQYRCYGSEQADIFLITFEKMKRYRGSWHCQEEVLFRGYVFADANSKEPLEQAAFNTAMFRTFGSYGYSLCLEEMEQRFLEDIGGQEHHIAISRGYIRDGITFVTEGPLCGKEYKIRKIDRHRRMARIEYPLKRCWLRELWMGLEITEKS